LRKGCFIKGKAKAKARLKAQAKARSKQRHKKKGQRQAKEEGRTKAKGALLQEASREVFKELQGIREGLLL
jgi:ribosomal protein L19E